MTVDSLSPLIRYKYTGPGSYAFSFKIFAASDVFIQYIDPDGLASSWVRGLDYDVTTVDGIQGGTCVCSNAAVDGFIEIYRQLPRTQEVDLINGDALDVNSIETALDRAVMIIQQQQLVIDQTAISVAWRGNWEVSGQNYFVGDVIVAPDSNWYVCVEAHISGTSFPDDLTAGYWVLAYDISVIEGYKDLAETAAAEATLSASSASLSATASAASAGESATYRNAAQLAEANSAENAQNAANCAQDAYDSSVVASGEADRAEAAADSVEAAFIVHKTSSTGAAEMPVGTTAQRPAASSGMLRFNSDIGSFEGHDGTDWGSIGGGTVVPESIQTADFTAEIGKAYPVDASAGDITMTLPTTNLSDGDWVTVFDVNGTVSNATRLYVTGTVYGDTEGFYTGNANISLTFQYRAASDDWNIVNGIGEGTEQGGSRTTIWSGSAGDGVTVDWSDTDYRLSDFDEILLVAGLPTRRFPTVITPSLLKTYGVSVARDNSTYLNSNGVTDTSFTVVSPGSFVLTEIYGIKYGN